MYINHRRIINTDSKVVHGVYPDNKKSFCGYFIDNWKRWEDTDKKATCKNCRKFLKKKGAI